MAFAAVLPDRGALRVSGGDAPHFLNNLVTSAVETLQPGQAAYAGLLTPQGKIISDFFVLAVEPGYLLDLPRSRMDEIRKRLTLYKLRAKVAVDVEDLSTVVIWDAPAAPELPNVFADPRLPALGWRALLPANEILSAHSGSEFQMASAEDYLAHRVSLGIPEGGRDFAFDDAFPHEADMDQLGGIDFRKGCYIGQEVVSRTQHRSTARTRIVPVELQGHAPEGSPITAGDRILGTLNSVAGARALATIRIDRADDALAAGEPMRAGETMISLVKPHWARFRFPGEPLPETVR